MAAFHYENNRICILDWEKAWLAGAIKKEDVPEPKRWWSEAEPDSLAAMSKDQLKAIAADRGVEIDLRWTTEKIGAAIEAHEVVAV